MQKKKNVYKMVSHLTQLHRFQYYTIPPWGCDPTGVERRLWEKRVWKMGGEYPILFENIKCSLLFCFVFCHIGITAIK